MPRNGIIVSILVLVTALVFGWTARHEFLVWDDDKNIFKNDYMSTEHLDDVDLYWKEPFLGMVIPVTYTIWSLIARCSDIAKHPSPLNTASHDADIISPFLFHIANTVFHIASVLLVMLLIYRLLGKRDLPAAAAGAALFAFHPLQVEPVAWATGFKDVFSTFMALLCIHTFLSYSRAAGAGKRPQAVLFYLLALVLFVAGLLSKPSLVFIPPALLLIERLLFHVSWKRLAFELIPYFILGIAATLLTSYSQEGGDELFPTPELPLWTRPVIALDTLVFYLGKLVYPFGLISIYGRSPDVQIDIASKYPLWIIPILVAIGILFIRKNRPYYWTAFGLALLAVAPVSGLVPFAFQGQSTVADRYMYVSMIGIGMALATWLTFSGTKLPHIGVLLILPLLAVASRIQVSHWKDTTTLFGHLLTYNPESVTGNYDIGLAYGNAGKTQLAIEYYQKTMKLRPEFARPYNNMGFLLNNVGSYQAAIPYLEKAIELQPSYAGSYSNMGISFDGLKQYDKAVECYQKSLELNPASPETMVNFGVALTGAGRYDEAIRYLKQASVKRPHWFQPYQGMGNAFMNSGRWAEAIQAYSRLVAIQKTNPNGYSLLAQAFWKNGQLPEACAAGQRAVELARAIPDYPSRDLAVLEGFYQKYLTGEPPP